MHPSTVSKKERSSCTCTHSAFQCARVQKKRTAQQVSVGSHWFTLVHMALSAINGGFTFISFDRFLISLSNFQTHWCRRHSIGSFPAETWSEQANCIFVVIVYIALKTRQYIEIMSFFGDFFFKGVQCPWTFLSLFCTSKTSPRPLFVFCTTSIRSCTQPHRFLLGQVWEVSIVCHVACSMLCIYLCSL